jgi:hypothetical protein
MDLLGRRRALRRVARPAWQLGGRSLHLRMRPWDAEVRPHEHHALTYRIALDLEHLRVEHLLDTELLQPRKRNLSALFTLITSLHDHDHHLAFYRLTEEVPA